jgi:predicted Rdx family selenoprotein
VRVAHELLSNYQHLVTDLKLVTGGRGIFDVDVDGTTIYSKDSTGRHANQGEVLGLFEALVPAGTHRFET